VGIMAVTYSKRHFVIGLLCEILKKKKKKKRGTFPAILFRVHGGIKRYAHFAENAALTKLTTLSVNLHLMPHPQYKTRLKFEIYFCV